MSLIFYAWSQPSNLWILFLSIKDAVWLYSPYGASGKLPDQRTESSSCKPVIRIIRKGMETEGPDQ